MIKARREATFRENKRVVAGKCKYSSCWKVDIIRITLCAEFWRDEGNLARGYWLHVISIESGIASILHMSCNYR